MTEQNCNACGNPLSGVGTALSCQVCNPIFKPLIEIDKGQNARCPECGCIGDCWKHGTKPINEGITLAQAEAYMLEARIEDREKTKALMEYTGDTKLWYEDNEEKLSQLKSQLSQEIMKLEVE